jgi:polysaccharide deacetylase 2 family uncharacterized protein YibQ
MLVKLRLSQFFLTVLLLCSAVFAFGEGKVVLVMDDLGNQRQSGIQSVELSLVTTVAIMPGRPFTKELATLAHQLGKEVIIHSPMANSINFPLGPLGLAKDDGREQLIENVRLSIASVPHAVGLSNHMGSALTQDAEVMGWIMAELKRHDFYFFDSRTTAQTIAWQIADQTNVPWAMRHIFLDHYKDHDFMTAQWQEAVSRAANGENITVIAHPYPETLVFLTQQANNIEAELKLAPLSEVLHQIKLVKRSSGNIPRGV